MSDKSELEKFKVYYVAYDHDPLLNIKKYLKERKAARLILRMLAKRK